MDSEAGPRREREASLEGQVRLCKEWIAAEGWELVQVFQDRALSEASALQAGYQALLASAQDGAFDVVVAEGSTVVTLSEGEVSELHVGLKGTMNALFLRGRLSQAAALTRKTSAAFSIQSLSVLTICDGLD
jgi:cell division inhibitor SulA